MFLSIDEELDFGLGFGDARNFEVNRLASVNFDLLGNLVHVDARLFLTCNTDKHTDRKTDRQTARQTDSKTNRQTARQTDRKRQTDRHQTANR